MEVNQKDIDNTIKILLKGAEDHSAIEDIEAKVKQSLQNGKPLNIKLGLDPSAPDIHLGHAVVLRKVRQLQDLGHRATIIIGDFTGRIGDPTGKSKTRKQLSDEQVLENSLTYQKQIFKILDKDKTTVEYNSRWLNKMNFADVIELASHCTVARILERDDFSNRFHNHQPIAVHEFFYPLMQAYDSVVIKADIEIGGTDQTFNILMGRNIQRDYNVDVQIALFMPLLEGIDGVEKMSKSLGNYIGVSESPEIMFEKVMKIPDDKIIKYYNLCTDIHPDDIAKIEQRLNAGENPRDIKMELASEIVKLYHDEQSAIDARERFVSIYQKNIIPDDVPTIDGGANGLTFLEFVDALANQNAYKSKSEVRRILQQGGIKVNDIVTTSMDGVFCKSGDIVKVGKKSIFKII